MAQTHQNLEIIVVAHGCDDNTCYRFTWPDIWNEVKEKRLGQVVMNPFPDTGRIKVISIKRRHHYPMTPENRWFAGPVEPLNEALKHVTGDWIARIDDDDEWVPSHIEMVLNYATLGKFEFVSCAHETHEGWVQPYRYGMHAVKHAISCARPNPGSIILIDEKQTREPSATIGGTQTWLYRSYLKFFKYNPDCWRKAWNKVNDVDLSVRMMQAGVRMGYLPAVHAKVLPRPGETEVGLKAYTRKGTSQ